MSSNDETVASPAPPRLAADVGHFVPGQILADRYRMLGLLGKGGMGEVYRADDMKLGQPVALKFLPRDVEGDRDRLDRFLTEVRLSLRVTHPNVCRVFDIGRLRPDLPEGATASQGQSDRHFLSMEFVDGEDLASLLRRIGRLPEDKAVEIARQLCAGLAAAHEEGVLHRDLKPANIMIDGRGRAKITDFGLAGATAGIVGREAQAGTPQYMAPEQFDGRELTVQTDLYSLGLVLYELFTGRRAFNSHDLHELAQMRSSTPTSPSAHVAGLNPVVERAILRCVDPDPARRPKSSSSLAAALPGGDPLAMAIAAGETPSPEMVARSGGAGELRPVVAGACLATVLVGLAAVWLSFGRTDLQNLVPMPTPPAELRVAARNALAAAGHTGSPGGTAHGFERDADYFREIEKTDQSIGRWDGLATVTPSPVWFWYRESPRPMAPVRRFGPLGPDNPPVLDPGMARVRLDSSGRLLELRVVPPESSPAVTSAAEPDWTPLFSAAALKRDDWVEATPIWTSPHAADLRRAWTMGTLRVEAAAFHGRPVWFRIVPPWRKTTDDRAGSRTSNDRAASLLGQALIVVAMVGGALLARRNLQQGRSDRRGAARLAAVYVCLGVAYGLLYLSGEPEAWLDSLLTNAGTDLLSAALIWMFYVAVEPYVRRLWPGTLIAWSRVLEGRLRDPMVGRHILLGAIAGLGFSLLDSLPIIASRFVGVPAPVPASMGLDSISSGSSFLAAWVGALQGSFALPVVLLLLVLVVRVVFRRPWLAYAVCYAIAGVLLGLGGPSWPVFIGGMLFVTLIFIVLTRMGLFALLVAIVFSSWTNFALTVNSSSWFFSNSVVVMAVFTAVAAYGFWVSLGGQKVFKDSILN